MGLHPCKRCFRHVRDAETACPFCGAAVERGPRRATRAGRFARAALFASTSLAACDQGKPAQPPPAKESPRAPRIHGTVVDQNGAPVVGANVQIAQGARHYDATTDHDGRYALADLEPGACSLSVSFAEGALRRVRQGFDTRQLTVVAGEDQKVDLTLTIMDQPAALPYGAPPRRTRVV